VMRKWAMGWEKVFASHMCDKGLVSIIYKEHLIQQSENKTGKDWTFYQRRHLDDKQTLEKMFESSVIMEM
jgi:hypothetical protein